MEYDHLRQALQGISGRDPEQKKRWYSLAAEAYHSTRPRYPAELIASCRAYPSVDVINTSFENWDVEPESIDAVLAASSMHWIPAETGFAKASCALKRDGYLTIRRPGNAASYSGWSRPDGAGLRQVPTPGDVHR
jgi:hypothetical protein